MTRRSPIREALQTRGVRPGASAPRRFGLLDLPLAVVILLVVATRTPIGSLLWFGVERLRGHERELPTLTAFFDSGAVAPPLPEAITPPTPGNTTKDQLPEPWRTGAITMLTAEVPAALLATLPPEPTADPVGRALAALDSAYGQNHDAAWTLEVAAVGEAAALRAAERAEAAGESEPRRFEAHRRFLPVAAAREADRFVGGSIALATALDFAWPLDVPHRVTSPFGERIHPTLKVRKNHTGVDLGVPIGTRVRTAQAGRLSVVGESAVSGKYVVVDHGFGVRTSYCHLSETPLAQGGTVARGDEIARSGNTGRSTGPHLHYGVAIAGRWVDPERFRPAATTAQVP